MSSDSPWIKNIFKQWARGKSAKPKRRHEARPRAELLEDRVVPTVYSWVPTAAGSYDWNNASNWSVVSGTGTFPNAPGDVAMINSALAGAETINLNTGITVGTLDIGASSGTNAFTIAPNGGSLTLSASGGTATVAKTTGGADQITAPLTFASPVAFDNSLSAPNTLAITGGATGTVALTVNSAASSAGEVDFTAANALNTTTGITVDAGTLGINSLTVSKNRLLSIGSGAFVNSSGTLSTTADGSVNPNPQVIGAGTLNLVSTTNDGVNNFDIYFNSNDTPGSTANWGSGISANINLGSSQRYFTGKSNHNAYGVYGTSTDVYLSGAISGTGGVTFDAQTSGFSNMEVPFALAGADTFTGPVVIQRGSVYLANANALNGNNVTFSPAAGQNARLYLDGFDTSIGNLSSSGAGTAEIANSPGSTASAATLTITQTTAGTYAGSFADIQSEYSNGGTVGSLSLAKSGSATLTLSGTSSYTGATTVNAGTLSVSADACLGATEAGGIAIDGGTLLASSSFTLDSSRSVTLGDPVTPGTSGEIDVAAGATLTYAGSITDNTGGDDSLIVGSTGNTGVLVLDGATSFTGNLTVNAGTLAGSGTVGAVADNAVISPGAGTGTAVLNTGDLSFGSGGVLAVDVNGAGSPGANYDQVNVTGTINLTNATLDLNLSYAPTIGDSYTIIHNVNGTAVTGHFNGILQNGYLVASGHLFQVNYQGNGNNDVVVTAVTPPTYYAEADGWGGSYTVGQIIPQPDPVNTSSPGVHFGGGTAVPGSNYKAFTSVNAALTQAADDGAVGANIVINGGTFAEDVVVTQAVSLDLQYANTTLNSLAVSNSNGSVELNGITLTTGDNNAASTTIASPISGSGSLVKTGTDTLTLSGNNSAYAGTVEVSAGILQLGSATALGASTAVQVDATGDLQLDGNNSAFASLAGSGIIENASATPATLTLPASGTFGGILQDGTGGGALSVTANGGLTFTLSGTNNSYTGVTTIGYGTLDIASLANGGSNSSIGASTNAASNLVINGGTLDYPAVGSTVSTDRSLTIGSGGGTINVDDPGSTLTFTGAVNGGLNNFNTGGAGTLIFSTANALTTGNITINSGTLSVNTITVSLNNEITIGADAFLVSTGTLNTTADPNDYPLYEVNGEGTLELRSTTDGPSNPDIYFNSNDVAGSTANWGTALSANIDLGSSQRYFSGQIDHNGFGVYGDGTDAYITSNISGSGGITFVGQPTLRSDMEMPFVFTGTNTFTGPIDIDRGSVYLDSPTAFPGGNDVNFDVTAGEGNLFLYGNDISIGTLTSTGTGGVAQIAVGNRATGAANYLPPSTLTINEAADSTFNGSFLDAFYEYSSSGSQTQGPLSIDVNGPGTLTLTGASTITGSVTVNTGVINNGTFSSGAGVAVTAGYLTNNGSFTDPTGVTVSAATLTNNGSFTSSGGFAISSGATLAGTGTETGDVSVATGATVTSTGTVTGTLTVAGTMDPAGAAATGIMSASNLSFGTGGTYDVELHGTVAGASYDQVSVSGSIDLTNAKLDIAGVNGVLTGAPLVIVNNTGSSPITGTFMDMNGNPLTEGSTITISGMHFTISYVGGANGDSVTLTEQAASAIYVESDWAGLYTTGETIPDADPVAAGNQPAVYGTTAFSGVTAALAGSDTSTGSVIVVNGINAGGTNVGTYNEDVVLTQSVTLDLQGGPISFNSLSDASPTVPSAVNLNGVQLTVGADNLSTTYSGTITGAGSLASTGTGTFTLTGLSGFSGGTTITNGTVVIGNSSALGTGSITVAGGATLQLDGNSLTVGSLSGSGTVDNNSSTPASLTITATTSSTFAGTISDTGTGALSLVVTGSGTFTLGSSNTYVGSTTVNGATLDVSSLALGGMASSIGESSNAASNLVLEGGATLDYTGTSSTTDRSITLGTGGGTLVVANAGSTLTISGNIANGTNAFTLDGAGDATIGGAFTGTTGTVTKNGAGTDTFTSNLAFGSTNNLTTYGSITTGDVTVNEGQLVTGSIRLNAGGRAGGLRGLSIAAGAIFTSTGTVAIDPSDSIYETQIAGPGTLQLRNPDASESNPSLMDDAGPNGGDGGPWGSLITAVVDVGDTGTQVMDGKTNRNDVSRYSGDIRFDAPITGSANIQFYGLNNNSNRSMHFVLNADNSGTAAGSPPAFTGGVLIANCDLDLTNNNALTAANSVTFDSVVNSNTLDLGSLYLWGYNVTIGSLNDLDAPSTIADIRNGASMNGNGGGGPGGTVLAQEAPSILTITQTVSGTFNGVFCDGPNDAGNGTTEVAGDGYEPLSINVTGTAPLTLTGTSSISGSVSVDPSTLINNGAFTAASGFTVSTGSTLYGTGTDDGGVVVSGTIEPGTSSATGILTVDYLSFGTGGALAVKLNGSTAGSNYDQVVATTLIDLSNATLDIVSVDASQLTVGTPLVIVNNMTGSLISGSFMDMNGNPLPEGSSITVSGVVFTISYAGGTSDNVTLTPTYIPPSITTTNLPNGTVGQSYNQTVGVTDGAAPYSFAVTTGSLPTGLSLNPSTGAITGTPTTTTGSPFSFTVTVTDADSNTASQAYTVAIASAGTPITVVSKTVNGDLLNVTSSISSATESAGSTTVQITTSSADGFYVGEMVKITGVATAAFNGTYTVASVIDATDFTYTDANFNASSPGSISNGGSAVNALGGAQRSIVDAVTYVFNQAVTLGTGAISMDVNSSYTGTAGILPTISYATIDDGHTWIVTFSGSSVTGNSIADGVYDITLNASAVTADVGSGTLASSQTDTFFRLFGDSNGDASVTSRPDVQNFAASFGSSSTSTAYLAYFDYNADGSITSRPDVQNFATRFGTSMTGFTPTL